MISESHIAANLVHFTDIVKQREAAFTAFNLSIRYAARLKSYKYNQLK